MWDVRVAELNTSECERLLNLGYEPFTGTVQLEPSGMQNEDKITTTYHGKVRAIVMLRKLL